MSGIRELRNSFNNILQAGGFSSGGRRMKYKDARTSGLNGPIVRQAPQIFYGSVFPNSNARMNSHCKKERSLKAYQGASDFFLGPNEELKIIENLDLDFEPELAIITDEVPAGISVAEAEKHIKLLTACNDFTYRKLVGSDVDSGFGFVQSKPLTSFCGSGVSPATDQAMWNKGRPILELEVTLNGRLFCKVSTVDMLYSFSELVAYCAKTRDLPSGTVITSGAVSTLNTDLLSDCCIAERHLRRKLEAELVDSIFLNPGDSVRIDFYNLAGVAGTPRHPLFGSLENTVVAR